MRARSRLLLSALAVVLAASTVPVTAFAADGPDDPAAVARAHLTADAAGRIQIDRDGAGDIAFVGTAAHASIDNPTVRPDASVASAARAHLDRYGAALGAARGSAFVQRSVSRAVSGVDVVRFEQTVSGVPVLGGDVVLGLGPDRGLRSLSADVASSARLSDATIAPTEARQGALGVVRRAYPHADLAVTDQGRWVLDPTVAGLSVPGGVRTVRRVEVGDGAGVRQLVLVDDHTGGIVYRTSLIEEADRVVCDRNNVRGAETPCTSGFARIEGQPATGVTDVDQAYDFSGDTSAFYQQVGALDLTALLGVDVAGVKKLASTVRFCTNDLADSCPFENAYWNGTQMYYGNGFAAADDVVGHEMTHGVVDQFSKLFYWGQSGAINESLADTIGELIDQRSTGDDDSAWDLGEDLTGIGPLRNMADPTAYDQPDSMTSANYTADDSGPDAYGDNAGVHTNSGVGNKTAYLISQGGTFNGQTITGIDAADPTLTKTGKLYVDVIESLPSGADYATLAHVLDQSCADLLSAGSAGYTAATCTAVHQAGVATRLTTTPPNASQPADAPTTCPAETTKRVLLDGESAPATKFAPVTSGWSRQSTAGNSNATSGTESWFADDPSTTQTRSLRSSSSIALPSGQPSYLSFQGWYLLDREDTDYYDGGTVEIAKDGGSAVTATGTWENGPNRILTTLFGNPNGGKSAFAGDSRGWIGSRLDLASYAGSSIRPQFTMRTDSAVGSIGWYLDDVTVYTCDRVLSAPRNVRVTGGFNSMTVTWAPPASQPSPVAHYEVDTPNGLFTVPATASSLAVSRISAQLAAFQVSVTAVGQPGDGSSTSPWVNVRSVSPSLRAKRINAKVRFKGLVGAGGTMVAGGLVKIQRKTSTGWVTVKSIRTRSDGSYVTTVKRRKRAYYRAAFMGGINLVGRVSVVRHR